MRKCASRLLDLPPYPFAQWRGHIDRARAEGLDVIRLDIGSPDMPPADDVIETLRRSAQRPEAHGYPGYRGTPELREAIASYYSRRFGVALDPQTQVVPLIGSKEGIVNMSLACLDPNDLVLVPDPGYAPYARGAILAGGTATPFPLLAENDFLPDLSAIVDEVADRAVMMWLNYPNNPTGAVADLDFFARAVAFARERDLLLCHDAPYCDVTYGDTVAPSLLQVEGAIDVAVEFNSLSKLANMAGWRVGMAVGNPEALSALMRVKSNVDSGIFGPLQEAAARALSLPPQWIEARNAIYDERMAIVVEALEATGMKVVRPRATLYAWARVPQGEESTPFARALLMEEGVAVAPGPFFGPAGEGYVRIAVTASTERVQEAMDRLRRFVKA